MKKAITAIARILVGALFIFSGIIKANDPLGFAYKLQEYFAVFGMEFLDGWAVSISIFACILEVFIGVLLLIGLWAGLTVTLLLLLIIFFGFLTFYSAYFGVVQDCGCFGDFLKLTPWESFYKNLILFAFILWLTFFRSYIQPLFNEFLSKRIAVTALVLSIIFPIYTYNYLPIWDFRPYEVGNNIQELMTVPEDAPKDQYETRLIYKNSETGEKAEFPSDSLPNDPWKWDTTINKLVQKGYEPPIKDFAINDSEGYDYTNDFLSQKGYRIVIIQYDLKKSNTTAQAEVNELAEASKANEKIGLWALTASADSRIESYREKYEVPYRYHTADGTVLKTIIRANPGILLMKGNTIEAKWSDLSVPSMEEVEGLMKE